MNREGKRPAEVTVLGWVFIGLAALMLVGAVGSAGAATVIRFVIPKLAPPDDAFSGGLGALLVSRRLFLYYVVGWLVVIPLAIFAMVAAIKFLRLRAWARAGLEVVSWLALVFTVGLGVFWFLFWVGEAPSVMKEEGAPAVVAVASWALMALASSAGCAVVCGLLIWLLRRPVVREAMR